MLYYAFMTLGGLLLLFCFVCFSGLCFFHSILSCFCKTRNFFYSIGIKCHQSSFSFCWCKVIPYQIYLQKLNILSHQQEKCLLAWKVAIYGNRITQLLQPCSCAITQRACHSLSLNLILAFYVLVNQLPSDPQRLSLPHSYEDYPQFYLFSFDLIIKGNPTEAHDPSNIAVRHL